MQNKHKNKAVLYYLQAKNFYEKYKKTMIVGAIFWVGLFAVLVGGRMVYNQHKAASYTTYKSVAMSPTNAMKQIKHDFNTKHPFTIVLYSSTCSDCKRAEKPLVKDFAETRANSNADYILTDLTKFNSSQRKELIRLLPRLTVQGNKFYVPTVANVKPINATHAKVTDINQNTSEALYHMVFDNGKI